MYYILRRPPLLNDNGELLVEIHNSIDVGDVWGWRNGEELDDDDRESIPELVEIEFSTYRGYDGPPVEMVDVGVPLMSKRLAQVMLEFGINNIEFFPAVLQNRKNNRSYEYFIYNIIGLISAADMNQSEYTSYDKKNSGDVGFTKLVIDESKTNGLFIFRLAENYSAILVHEDLKSSIEKNGIDTLTFMRPEEWIHL